jgi:hypothetical protein
MKLPTQSRLGFWRTDRWRAPVSLAAIGPAKLFQKSLYAVDLERIDSRGAFKPRFRIPRAFQKSEVLVFDYRVEAQQNRPFGRGPEKKLLLVGLKQE